MIGAPNTQGQKYWVGIVQWAPETSVLEEIADIFRNYNIDNFHVFHTIYIYGFDQDSCISSALALKIPQPCTKP